MPQEQDVPDGSGTGWATVSWAQAQLTASGPGSGVLDGFVFDPERAAGTIKELTRIADEVRQFLTKTTQLTFVPPGHDEVSVNLAKNGDLMARRAELFVRAWASQIDAIRIALQAQLDAYVRGEEISRDLLP